MPAAKPAKVEAATDEVAADTTPKQIEWRGATFTLQHDELPADILWIMADIEQGKLSAMLEFFTLILGVEQSTVVREKLRTDGVTVDQAPDALGEILSAVLEAYGMAEGDSDASPQS